MVSTLTRNGSKKAEAATEQAEPKGKKELRHWREISAAMALSIPLNPAMLTTEYKHSTLAGNTFICDRDLVLLRLGQFLNELGATKETAETLLAELAVEALEFQKDYVAQQIEEKKEKQVEDLRAKARKKLKAWKPAFILSDKSKRNWTDEQFIQYIVENANSLGL